MEHLKIGDNFTLAGVHKRVRNGKRKWYQFWKPRYIQGPLIVFKVEKAWPPLSTNVWSSRYFSESVRDSKWIT